MTTDNNQTFDLEAFRAKRDAAQRKLNYWQTTASEITRAYEADERNLSRATLSRANLYGATLYGANLEGANLYGADLEGATLEGANLEGATLSRATLSRANLYGATLSRANLYGATLYGANLEGADLEGATLEGANLEGATLEGANILNAKGIYSAYALNLSSRGASLLGGITLEDGEILLRFWAGCKESIPAAQLLKYVEETHANNIHAQQYKTAIKFIQACFKSDMTAQKWDYLLTWKPAESEVSE